ncbi:MAG: DUF3426 domain-containing protein [Proteobacteria bacterium]|nr:DUF3426 domain-containing protein [Pseudomonadota bacterium]
MNEDQAFITCCPVCDTSFRVTPEQMEMASGAVRCGACLRIFQANEQKVEESATADIKDTRPELLDFGIDEIKSGYWQDWDLYVGEVFVALQGLEETAGAEESWYEDSSDADSYEDDFTVDGQVVLDIEEEEAESTTLVSLLDLEDDPQNLVGEQVARQSTHPVWFVALLVLVMLSLLQYAWFNRGIYAQQAEYRQGFLFVCAWIGCELPEYSNTAALSTSNLVIRAHPDAEGALIIDAIVRNSARYRQLFPVLQLQFQDIDNNLVAQRQFRPENYLAGELRGLRFIPGNTEVRFSLEIADPGKNALGYNLKIIQHRP